MSINYHVSHGPNVSTVVAVEPNGDTPIHMTDSTNPNWDEILAKLAADDDSVFSLFDPGTAAANKLMQLSDRVTYDHGLIRFDDEVQDNALAEHLVRVIRAGDDPQPVVKFWENIAMNPAEHSRKALFTWLATHEFAIDEEGYILAYKSLHSATDAEGNDTYRSGNSGHGFVNGVETKNGYLMQNVGDVVSMPRSEVDDNHNVDCSRGLHFGDWGYVETFSGNTKVLVRIHPRDVVSIPTSDTRKARCCRYEVVEIVTAPKDAPIVFSVEASRKAAQPVGYAPFG